MEQPQQQRGGKSGGGMNLLSLVETGRIRLVLELRFLMAMVSWGGNRTQCGLESTSQTPHAPNGSNSGAAAETQWFKLAAVQQS